MSAAIIKILLLLGILLPLIALTFNFKTKNYKSLLLFVIFYFIWCFFNSPLMGYLFSEDIIKSPWNWEGKILSIVASLLFVLIFRKNFEENQFFTWKQKPGSLKYTLTTAISILILANGYTYISSEKSPLSIDTLAFQLSMPGPDEEFAFRGIMMALLMNALNESFIIGKFKLGCPAVFISALIFGLIHGFPFTPNLVWQFDYFAFSYSFIFGLIWGWMVLKSRSILIPLASHSLNNFSLTLMTMIR